MNDAQNKEKYAQGWREMVSWLIQARYGGSKSVGIRAKMKKKELFLTKNHLF
jgi:hypothetical protein